MESRDSLTMLRVSGNQIVDERGKSVHLRGTCVGGWMNMENFINGYSGSESGIRAAMEDVLGSDKAQFFFDRMLDHFFGEDDVVYIKSCGATVVRLPMNYRHFERDDNPFVYLEAGFQRLDRAIDTCERHGLYVILDLHAVQGWQNTDWHCDNSSRHSLFWHDKHAQDRFVSLWEEIASRYRGRAVVAGYNVMNEPLCNAPRGRFTDNYDRDWDTINPVYRRVVKAIRDVDSDHIIFLEGDCFSSLFEGLEPPFAPNLVYSSHNYNAAGFGPGPYPGTIGGVDWNAEKQEEVFLAHEGTRFTQRYDVPLWVGEFGSVYNGPSNEVPDRLRALDDQIAVFERHGAHWTTWTYKDVGVMGWVTLDPQSEYMQRIRHFLEVKRELSTDFWMGWLPPTAITRSLDSVASSVLSTAGIDDYDIGSVRRYLRQHALSGYVGALIQPVYARAFRGLSESQLDEILQSFSLKNCRPNEGLISIVKRHMS